MKLQGGKTPWNHLQFSLFLLSIKVQIQIFFTNMCSSTEFCFLDNILIAVTEMEGTSALFVFLSNN